MGYEEEFLKFLQSLVAEVERRIQRGHQRLALNSTLGGVGYQVCPFTCVKQFISQLLSFAHCIFYSQTTKNSALILEDDCIYFYTV